MRSGRDLPGLALHWRELPAQARQALEARVGPAWAALARESGLALHPFDGGLELRLPGFHKGLAVTAMARDNPHSTLVYVGDDLTDEDAFQALGPGGLGVRPGSSEKGVAGLCRSFSRQAGYFLRPVSLTEAEVEGFYRGFSNEILWPLFHEFQMPCNFLPAYGEAHRTANATFAETAAADAGHSGHHPPPRHLPMGGRLSGRGLFHPFGRFPPPGRGGLGRPGTRRTASPGPGPPCATRASCRVHENA